MWLICTHAGSPVLHQRAALGPVLPGGGRALVNLSPGRLLGNPLEASTRTGSLERGPVRTAAGHGRQGGDVEDVPHAVLGIPGSALGVGHGSDLPRQMSAL